MKKNYFLGFAGLVIIFLGVLLLSQIIHGLGIYEKRMNNYVNLEAVVKDIMVDNKSDKKTYSYIITFTYNNQKEERETNEYSYKLHLNQKIQINYNPVTKEIDLIRTSFTQILYYIISVSMMLIGTSLFAVSLVNFIKLKRK